MICYMNKVQRYILNKLLTVVSRLENKLWRMLYTRPRKYCKCQSEKEKGLFEQFIEGTLPCKDMFKNDK